MPQFFPQFFVCFTGDAKHHRDDMIKIAKGAKGVYYTELDRAVYDAQKKNCPVFLVVGGRNGSSPENREGEKSWRSRDDHDTHRLLGVGRHQ